MLARRIIVPTDKLHLPAVAKQAHPREAEHEEREMKTLIIALAAVLGIATGAAALSPAVQAAQTQLFPPAQNGNN
jgi:hypothetical protein